MISFFSIGKLTCSGDQLFLALLSSLMISASSGCLAKYVFSLAARPIMHASSSSADAFGFSGSGGAAIAGAAPSSPSASAMLLNWSETNAQTTRRAIRT